MRIVASVQVRMASERLPGKVMMGVSGKPMLWYLIQRLRQSKNVDEISVATSEYKENDIIEQFCKSENISCFRGSEDDVLARTLGSLESLEAETGVVVYGDNPLIDPAIVDEAIEFFKLNPNLDWVGNDLKTTFPPGMEVEVFKVGALSDSSVRTKDPEVREHGTLFIRQNSSIYNLYNIEAEGKRRRPDLCLGVDAPEDFKILKKIIRHFGEVCSFTLEEIIEFLDHNPDLAQINRSVPRRWMRYRSEQ